MATLRPTSSRMVFRALALRCPNCGGRGIFDGYTTLRERCATCGLRLHRGENDYFIGAYLLNLVAVEVLFASVLAVIVIATYPNTPWTLVQWGGLVLMIVGAVVCYPFSKSLWLAADLIFRPMTDDELAWHHVSGEHGDRELPHI
jgi:uncharacterized protein (DUF983 family)